MKLYKKAVGFSNQPAFQPPQNKKEKKENMTIAVDCPFDCEKIIHSMKIESANSLQEKIIDEDKYVAVQTRCPFSPNPNASTQMWAKIDENGKYITNDKGQVIVITEPNSNQMKLTGLAGRKKNKSKKHVHKRKHLRFPTNLLTQDPTGIFPDNNRGMSKMNKPSDGTTNHEDYPLGVTAQKRDENGIPTKDNYFGPRVFRMHEDVAPQGIPSISPHTTEREEYKNQHKVIQSIAGIMNESNETIYPEGLEAKIYEASGSYITKYIKALSKEEVFAYISEKYPDIHVWDINVAAPEDWKQEDVKVIDLTTTEPEKEPRKPDAEFCMGMAASTSKGIKIATLKDNQLTDEQVNKLSCPHSKCSTKCAKIALIKEAAMYDQVQLVPGNGDGLSQWCPKLRAPVQMSTCTLRCIDARRVPTNKKWENFTDYLIEGGDPNGKVICGYKEWITREMDRFYPGWVEDHIIKAGGEISGSETNFGNRRMNLDEGERRHLPRYPEEKLIEKQMDVEEKHHFVPETKLAETGTKIFLTKNAEKAENSSPTTSPE